MRAFVGVTVGLALACGAAVNGMGDPQPGGGATPTLRAVGTEYAKSIRPLMQRACLGCHSTKKRAGELDLEQYSTLTEAAKAPAVWARVTEMLGNGEMPPKNARPITAAQRQQLIGWVKRFLDAEALASAGDPGPVVLRRLNNAEYTFTVRDLTGVDLDPAREFPADNAAGEGFTNTGSSLVMSPGMLSKYFDAGKAIAKHAELLPDGFRFSPDTTRADWTNDTLAQIRALYSKYAERNGASTVNLQGVIFKTNDGGRLPLQNYLSATLEERSALQAGDVEPVARKRGLNAKYLGILWTTLSDRRASPVLDEVRARWRQAKPADAAALTSYVGSWQSALWHFGVVGQIGRPGGPKSWQEPASPLATRREVRLKLPTSPDGQPVSVYLSARDAGDASAVGAGVWEKPRLVAPGRPDVLLRDLRDFSRQIAGRRVQLFGSAAKALEAADVVSRASSEPDIPTLAQEYGIEPTVLTAWLDYLGVGANAPFKLAHFSHQETNSTYPFIRGWGSPDLPMMVANASDQHVRIPGNMKPHGVCVHPTPNLSACIGWLSPITGAVRVQGKVTHAHPECGNGVEWVAELRHGGNRLRLAGGIAQGGMTGTLAPPAPLAVRKGDLISLVIGPRNHDHSCDLTDLELTIRTEGENSREWSLTRDVSDNVLAGNPHPDRFGNPEVWHFYSEPVTATEGTPVAPSGSLVARWQVAGSEQRKQIAGELQQMLTSGGAGVDPRSPNGALYRQLASFTGPLLIHAWKQLSGISPSPNASEKATVGLDAALFGKLPSGGATDPANLGVRVPDVVEVKIPADLAEGAELVATTTTTGAGSVQMRLTATPPGTERLSPDLPILTAENGPDWRRYEQGFADFRAVFPVALCYWKIVPVDEVVTMVLFHREDEPLCRLMLSASEIRDLDRLWSELRFVSQWPLKLVSAYEQIREFATQDRPDLAEPLKAMKQPIYDGAATFQRDISAAEPKQLDALVRFAGRAYRRTPTPEEERGLRTLYANLRKEGLAHEDAFRLTLARVFVAPAFLYRLENAPAGKVAAPVNDWELANRLSYFLWSSQPDEPLRAAAATGKLRSPAVLTAQTKRMLADPRMRRLATQFACQWLHIYEFDSLDEKSEKYFPEFAALRHDMYEEAIRFFTDLFQRDGSVLSLFDADYTYVNGRLARFYGIPGITGDEWRRVDGMRARGRGGVLGLSAILAKESGASRTSPILRGTWVSEVLLGDKLPKPPKDVPRLPEDETATDGLTVRQLVARHTSDPKCSGCHRKIDPFGFSLEAFDAIGRFRTTDLAHRPIDAKTQTPDGKAIDGLAGLRDYLLRTRREAVLRQFCRKLLGYALGRSIQLSDEPLLAEMERSLARNNYRFSAAIETIVHSRPFREIRGAGMLTAQAADHP